MLSDPKLQATFAIMKNPWPWRSALWEERDREIRQFARLATWAELSLTSDEFQLYSNGVRPQYRVWYTVAGQPRVRYCSSHKDAHDAAFQIALAGGASQIQAQYWHHGEQCWK